ncbi:MAG: hypothetical protein IJP81_00885 [Bacteroidales bacterium]|nr:hypothetical protein [Bacteroidales bacterium]
MKEFEDIVTDLPYKESPEYVEQLVSRSRAKAAQRAVSAGRTLSPWLYTLSGAAAAAAIAVGIFLFKPKAGPEETLYRSPMDSFLASISDTEASQIVDFPIDDIPEYYR